jgi:hypothetical protein
MIRTIFNFDGTDDERRQLLFDGALLFDAATPASTALVQHAQDLIREAFAELDPQHAQEQLGVDAFIEIIAPLKTRFTNGDKTKELVRAYMESLGMDLRDTYFDVPRLRVVPHSEYLTSGVSYAYKAHRDQWYGGPFQQLNYWMPVWNVGPANAMAFYPLRWDRPCENSSGEFDYEEWTTVHRPAAQTQVTTDTRKHPLPLEPLSESEELRYGAASGDVIIFAGAHLHATVPNSSGSTRFSLDFRTISLEDLERGRGAPNVDSAARGTTLVDYLRGDDFSSLERDRLPSLR